MSVIDLKTAREKLEKRSASQCQSTQNTGSDQTGQLPTEDEMLEVVMAVYNLLMTAKQRPFTTKSDMARAAADVVALCASEQLLSTMMPDGHFTNVWMITEDGLQWLEGANDALAPRH